MNVAYHPVYAHPIPANHRFPMDKYPLLYGQLLLEGLVTEADCLAPQPMTEHDILLSHTSEYWEALKQGSLSTADERRSGFKWSSALVHRETIIMQGTTECALVAAQGGVAMNIAGGTHHAFADRPEGFCLLNDLVLAADVLHSKGIAQRTLIVDLDVHQGNGTAALATHRDHIFALSLHGASNYPFHKETSSLDIPLPDGTSDEAYLHALAPALQEAFDRHAPDLVLYQCGVDVLATDKLGKLALSMEGCRKRDEMVFAACHERQLGVACAMGGGYSEDVHRIVEAHMQTFRAARDIYT